MACNCNNGCNKNHLCVDDSLLLILLIVWFLFFRGGCGCGIGGTATNIDTYRTNGCGCGD